MKLMKLSLFILFVFTLVCCKEEKQSPLFPGETPDVVKQYTVKNLPGAALITFKLDDPRTAYVKAVYTLKEGLTREAKASKYDNKLMVDGFAESKSYDISLYAVGYNEKESSPIKVTVQPETPPFQTVVSKLSVTPDWGGGKLKGTNVTSAKLMIGVLRRDPKTNEWKDVNVFFTESQNFDFNFRGLEPKETEFGVYTRDQWQNYSDTMTFKFEPWEEIKLPLTHQNFKLVTLPGDAAGQAAYGLSRLFDGVRFSWADGYYSVASNIWPKTFTIDLLKAYQLSRFKYWQNGNLYYQSANAKHIRIWGNNTLDPNFENWHLLGEWDDWRPSKRPPTTGNAGLTDEDKAAAEAGNDFDFPLDIIGVRYIRVETVSTWEPRTQVYFPELEFWGRPIK